VPQPIKAGIDFLTRCYMRDGLVPFLKELEQETLLRKKPFSVLVIDVDHFKLFNDKYGHLTGDEVLKYFSSSMRLDLEDEENSIFRFGGDEFVVVFPLKNASEAARLSSRLRKNMRKRACMVKGRQLTVTFSGGIACYPEDAKSIEQLFERADEALYFSKNHGRARVTCYNRITYFNYLKLALIIIFAGLFLALSYINRAKIKSFFEPLMRYRVKVVSQKNDAVSTPAPEPSPVEAGPAVNNTPSNPIVSVPDTGIPTVPTNPNAIDPLKISTIYLTTGRAVRGEILEDGEETVRVQISLNEGKGEIKIKRSQIISIERSANK
jgi:diguanylate cyclase (GGDEF)-like protein